MVGPRERLLNARPPSPDEVDGWLRLWTPELGKDDTCVVVEAPALRHRPDDVLPPAHSFAHRDRGREVTFTSAAAG
ncbi:hypothetical protein [Lentzea sp.]|uniref:hypothetical protein n=1 Tax=Lentzea sp. TaxID=56099 RepID=UPI002ED2DB1D